MLPSTVGGDGVRIWLFARKSGGWTSATYSVLIDRIAGVFTLALIVIACLPSTFSLIHDPIAARGPAGTWRPLHGHYWRERMDRLRLTIKTSRGQQSPRLALDLAEPSAPRQCQ